MDKNKILIFKVCVAALWANEKMVRQERDYVNNLIERFSESENDKDILRKIQTQDLKLTLLEPEIEKLAKEYKEYIFEECFSVITSDKIIDHLDLRFLKALKKSCNIKFLYYRTKLREARLYKGVKIRRNIKLFIVMSVIIWTAFQILPSTLVKKDFKKFLNENTSQEMISVQLLPNSSEKKKFTAQKVYENTCKSVVTVYVKRNNAKVSQGTGSIISKGENEYYILTNKHVVLSEKSKVKHPRSYEIQLYTGARFDAYLDFYSRKIDLAILRAKIPDEYVKIIEILPKKFQDVGDRVYVLGTPVGMTNTFTEGIISALRDEYIQTDATVFFGNSGGPLINEYAQLIGIVTKSFVFKDYSFAIYTDSIKNLINERERFIHKTQNRM